MNILRISLEVVEFILVVVLTYLMVMFCDDLNKMEHEAIRRGYAIYNQQGKFVWKEQGDEDNKFTGNQK